MVLHHHDGKAAAQDAHIALVEYGIDKTITKDRCSFAGLLHVASSVRDRSSNFSRDI